MDFERAKELLGEKSYTVLPDEDTHAQTWRKQLGLSLPEKPVLSFHTEIRPLTVKKPGSLTHIFWDYLYERGFTQEQALWAVKTYDLHYSLGGKYTYRIVIPIYTANRRLATWTARSIHPDAHVRYLTHPSDLSLAPTSNLLLGLPILREATPARCLVVCEGPFDAIAVSTLGHEYGIWGTCLFGLELSEAQADLLAGLADYFDRVKLLIDPDMALRVLSLRSRLPRQVRPTRLVKGLKDPGELIRYEGGKEFVLSLAA